jgi:hypothetical protein
VVTTMNGAAATPFTTATKLSNQASALVLISEGSVIDEICEFENGAPGRTRTCDLVIRSPLP